MRPITILGLAAVTALAAMAFVGASTASANGPTVLCTVDSRLTCPAANQVTLKLVHFVATNPQLLGPPNITCASALLSAESLHSGNPYKLHIHELAYSGCSTKIFLKINCTVTTTHNGLLDL